MDDWNKINIALYITDCDEKIFPLCGIDGAGRCRGKLRCPGTESF